MTVLGRGLVFQPVLVTQTCTYDSKYITLTLQIFHQKRRKTNKQNKTFFKKNITTPPPPKKKQKNNNNNNKKTHNNSNKRGHNTSQCFDMSLKLSKLQVKKNDKGHNQMTNIIEST